MSITLENEIIGERPLSKIDSNHSWIKEAKFISETIGKGIANKGPHRILVFG